MESLKRSTQDRTGRGGWVEPIDGTTADGSVATFSKTFDHIAALQLESIPVGAGMPCESHTKQLAGFGIDQRLITISHTGCETHPEGRMAAVREVAGCLCPVQRSHRLHVGQGSCRIRS